MHNQESIQENEMHKVLWDFEIQTDHLIFSQTTRFSDSQQKKKKKKKKENLPNSGLRRSGWKQGKSERKQKERLVPRPC